jgi:hypothetical protein
MKKVTAGVVTGLILGAVQGIVTEAGDAGNFGLFLAALARGSQGVINGILVAYLAKPTTPLWRGGLVGALIGALLAAVSGALSDPASGAIPWSIAVGACCGIAATRAAR